MGQLGQGSNGASVYKNGMAISNDATSPNTTIDVSAGIARDGNNAVDLQIGNYQGQYGAGTTNAPTKLSLTAAGLNGLDIGTVQANKQYYIYVIGCSNNKAPTGLIASLSNTAPALPFNYDSVRLIGVVQTNSSGNILPFIASGNFVLLDTPISVLTTGHATTYTAVPLNAAVPSTKLGKVKLQVSYTPVTAGDAIYIRPTGSSSDWFVSKGTNAGVEQDQTFDMAVGMNQGVPSLDYHVTAAGDAVSISVLGFDLSV